MMCLRRCVAEFARHQISSRGAHSAEYPNYRILFAEFGATVEAERSMTVDHNDRAVRSPCQSQGGWLMRIVVSTQRIGAVMFAAAVVAAFGGSVVAKDVAVVLSGSEETPPVTTAASGTGTITINADQSVRGTVKTKGIDGTVAHIHVGAPGVSGPPIVTLDKSADGVWTVPAGSKLTDDQYASFKAGNLYVNVHSAEHKPGEIRAQLKP